MEKLIVALAILPSYRHSTVFVAESLILVCVYVFFLFIFKTLFDAYMFINLVGFGIKIIDYSHLQSYS